MKKYQATSINFMEFTITETTMPIYSAEWKESGEKTLLRHDPVFIVLNSKTKNEVATFPRKSLDNLYYSLDEVKDILKKQYSLESQKNAIVSKISELKKLIKSLESELSSLN